MNELFVLKQKNLKFLLNVFGGIGDVINLSQIYAPLMQLFPFFSFLAKDWIVLLLDYYNLTFLNRFTWYYRLNGKNIFWVLLNINGIEKHMQKYTQNALAVHTSSYVPRRYLWKVEVKKETTTGRHGIVYYVADRVWLVLFLELEEVQKHFP